MAKAPTKPTRSKAMDAKCHECSAEYYDGKVDCEVPSCSLYSWMPYRSLVPDLKWMHFNPRRVGKVLWEESGREMSDEEKEKLAARLRKMRDSRNEEDGPQKKLRRRI